MRHLPAEILSTGLQLWLAALALILLLRLLRGEASITEMLMTHRGGGFAPDRVQGLLISLFAVGTLIVQAFRPDAPQASLPDVPEAIVVLLAGGNGLYLAGKVARTGGAV
jgi:hypothetical protein